MSTRSCSNCSKLTEVVVPLVVDAVNGSKSFALPFTLLLPAVQIAGLPEALA